MKNKFLVVLCCLLFTALVVVGVIFVYPSLAGNKGSSKGDNGKDEKDTAEPIAFTVEDGEALLKEFGFDLNVTCSANILDYEYSDTFKSIVAIYRAMNDSGVEKECSEVFDESQKVDDRSYRQDNYCWISEKTKVVDYDIVNSIYKKLYGSDIPKKSVSGTDVAGMFYYFYDYIESSNSFARTSGMGLGGSCGRAIKVFKVVSTDSTEDTVMIQVANYYLNNYELENGQQLHLVTSHTDEMIGCGSNEECQEKISNEYLDKLDQYVITFNLVDGNYILNSITKK